jgi:DNA (cytosine-5)-methyltransferase 1
MTTSIKQRVLFQSSEGTPYFRLLTTELAVGQGPGWPDQFGSQLSSWAGSAIKRPIRTLSLFSGMGGLDIAFHDAGFRIKEMVEIEKRFTATLLKNSGPGRYLDDSQVHCIDIREFDTDGEFDFIIGGPPCQTFSAAARRASGVSGVNDARGTLFQEYVRLLTRLKPKGFLFENVYGITGANGGKAWDQITEGFSNAGYGVSFRILDTADYGVPQHRERMFIVGLRDGGTFKFPQPTHGPDSNGQRPYYSACEAVEGVPLTPAERGARVTGRYEDLLEQVPPGLNYSYFTEKLGHPNPIFAWRSKFSDFLYKADPNSPIRTLKAQAGQFTGPFHWDSRPFTVHELKRLQTIPDAYEIVGGRQVVMHQIGNSVPSQVGRILALGVLEQVFGVTPPSPLSYMKENETLGFRTRKRQRTVAYRETAMNAIGAIAPPENDKSQRSRSYIRTLSDKFHWTKGTKSGAGVISVRVEARKEQWHIRVAQDNPKSSKSAFSLTVSPSQAGWGMPFDSAVLLAEMYSPKLFTSAWKAFEEELIHRNVKADLVQLCNYYQYEPAFSVVADFANPLPNAEWGILKQVCEGVGVRATMPAKELAGLWSVPVAEVLPACQFLRLLGYEVRNSNTNPEIPKGYYLIPYAFPTFNPRSVQLGKQLA